MSEFVTTAEALKDYWQETMELAPFIRQYHNADSYLDKLGALREYYKFVEARIIELSSDCIYRWFDAYPVDWLQLFTPIEMDAWNSIRCKGRIVLYPQYPVLDFIIDFANPYLRIGLELDGKEFHEESKDRKRDALLREKGWTIYRITGKEMWRNNYKDFSDYDGLERHEREVQLRYWIMQTGDGVIEAIRKVHFYNHASFLDESMEGFYQSLCEQTLQKHSFNPL